MRTEKEIREMRDAKKKQACSEYRPYQIRLIDAACTRILDWVLEEENEESLNQSKEKEK